MLVTKPNGEVNLSATMIAVLAAEGPMTLDGLRTKIRELGHETDATKFYASLKSLQTKGRVAYNGVTYTAGQPSVPVTADAVTEKPVRARKQPKQVAWHEELADETDAAVIISELVASEMREEKTEAGYGLMMVKSKGLTEYVNRFRIRWGREPEWYRLSKQGPHTVLVLGPVKES